MASLVMAAISISACRPGPVEVTMPVSNWPGHEYFYLAAEKELDRQHGIKLNIHTFSDPQSIVHGYLRGELPLAQLTTVEAVDICNRVPKLCPVIVLVLDDSHGADQVAARPGIRSMAELRGKLVGVTVSSLGPYVLSRGLAKAGMNLTDVRLLNMQPDTMPDALEKGMVDAVVFFPPYSKYAARRKQARVLFDSRAIKGELLDVLAVNPNYFANNQKVLASLLVIWQSAHDLANANPHEARDLIARRHGLSVAEYSDAEGELLYFPLSQQERMLAPDGMVERNLRMVQEVQQQLQLIRPNSLLPKVSNAVVHAALH